MTYKYNTIKSLHMYRYKKKEKNQLDLKTVQSFWLILPKIRLKMLVSSFTILSFFMYIIPGLSFFSFDGY